MAVLMKQNVFTINSTKQAQNHKVVLLSLKLKHHLPHQLKEYSVPHLPQLGDCLIL